MTKINCLDHGYVRLVNHMGSDASIINAARVSFDRECIPNADGSLAARDIKLMAFLVRNKEMSVFRQATVQFEMYMPLFTARQYWKYIVGASHIDDGTCMNESSRRYITEEPVFYIPDMHQWRSAPDNKKQGSGTPVDERLGQLATNELMDYIDKGLELYDKWISIGIAPELTRLFLPSYGMYVRIRSTLSLAALIHFLQERLEHKAQHEIYVYAKAARDLVKPLFPVSFEQLGL